MKKFINSIGQRKNQLLRPLYPQLVKSECGGQASVFEVTNQTERYRAETLGGEREYLERVLDRIEPDDVFWDVGANIGVYSIFTARSGAEVHAYEPDPDFANHLRTNIELNGQSGNVNVHELAMSEESGTTTLYTDGVDGRSPSLASEGQAQGRVTVQVVRGDDVDSPSPDVLKMDIEGAEVLALAGLEETLEQIRVVAVEVHPSKVESYNRSPEYITELLEDSGFVETWTQERKAERQFIFERRDVT